MTRRVALLFDLHRADHHTRQLVTGIARYAAEAAGRWRLILDPFAALRLAPAGGAARTPYDGLLGPGSETLPEQSRRAGIPYVAATCEAITFRSHRVAESTRRGGRLAARHLQASGFAHLAFAGFDRDGTASLLEKTFRYHARKRGQSLAVLRINLPSTSRIKYWTGALDSLSRWLDELPRPIGIFACSDLLARYLVDLALDKGLRIPDDVAIIGAGNDPAVIASSPVRLASIDFQWETVGYRAAQLLDRLMDGAPPPGRNVLIPPRLIVRDSAASRPRGEDVIAPALDYIAANCRRPLRVAEIARAVGASARTLVRRFQDARRSTVVEEIAAARLARARDLLRSTDLTLEAIARATGLGSAHRLALVFRRAEGVSPSAWRSGRAARPGDDVQLAEARKLLERTTERLDDIALLCGFRTVGRFRYAFRRHEGCTPSEYRVRHGRPPRGARRPQGLLHPAAQPPPGQAARPFVGGGFRVDDLPPTPPWAADPAPAPPPEPPPPAPDSKPPADGPKSEES